MPGVPIRLAPDGTPVPRRITGGSAPRWESDTVSAIVVPEGRDAAKVIDIAYHRKAVFDRLAEFVLG